MKDFKKNPRFDGPRAGGGFKRPSFGGGRGPARSGGRDFGSSERFQATCSKCNNTCEVPFRPNGKKPVYCRDCFVKDDSSRPSERSFGKREFTPRTFSSRPPEKEDRRIGDMAKRLESVEAKLDLLIASMKAPAPAAAPAESLKSTIKKVQKKTKVAKKK